MLWKYCENLLHFLTFSNKNMYFIYIFISYKGYGLLYRKIWRTFLGGVRRQLPPSPPLAPPLIWCLLVWWVSCESLLYKIDSISKKKFLKRKTSRFRSLCFVHTNKVVWCKLWSYKPIIQWYFIGSRMIIPQKLTMPIF